MTAEPANIALLARVLNGDETGLAALVSRYWQSLVRYSHAILHDPDTAEDVAQEVFVRLWEHRDKWGLEGSVLGLLFRIARNLSLDERRQRDARRRAAGNAAEPPRLPCPDEQVFDRELGDAIRLAVEHLPERRREVFLLVRLHGLSYREAAEALGIAPQTVANHFSMALADLREDLASHIHDRMSASARPNLNAAARYAGGNLGA